MKKMRYSEHQIIRILKQGDAGLKAADWCREHGINPATYYKWKAKDGEVKASDVKRLQEIERFKQAYREEVLDFYLFASLQEARDITDNWQYTNNHLRPLDALHGSAPVAYLTAKG